MPRRYRDQLDKLVLQDAAQTLPGKLSMQQLE